MKKFAMLALMLSLSVFSLGCSDTKKPATAATKPAAPVDKMDTTAPAPAVTPEPAKTEGEPTK